MIKKIKNQLFFLTISILLFSYIFYVYKTQITMKENKEKPVTVRLPTSLYEHYLEKALKRAQKERRIVKISEVLREALEQNK
jgi:hypothetical protein